MTSLKALAREALPKRFQVPIKYRFGNRQRELEPEMSLLPKLVSRGDHAIDIGGNRGAYAFRPTGFGVRVSAFGPNPVCLAALTPRAARKPAVAIHPVGLRPRRIGRLGPSERRRPAIPTTSFSFTRPRSQPADMEA